MGYKLQTNIPVTGRPQYVNYWTGKDWKDPETGKVKKLPDTVSIKGTWDVDADTVSFLPLGLVTDMMNMGMIEDNGTNQYGNPDYRVIKDDPIRITKTEDGKSRYTVIEWADGAPAQAQQQPTAAPMPAEVRRQVATNEQKSDRAKFKALVGTFKCCMATAWGLWYDDPQEDPASHSVIQATEDTLFIEAYKRNFTLTP